MNRLHYFYNPPKPESALQYFHGDNSAREPQSLDCDCSFSAPVRQVLYKTSAGNVDFLFFLSPNQLSFLARSNRFCCGSINPIPNAPKITTLMIRTVVERLARGRALQRRMPKDFASRPIFVSPDAALSYLKPFWANSFADLLSAAKRFANAGDHIWDVGGNVGVFALAAAHQAGPSGSLLAIEADPFLASLLQKTFRHPKNEDRQLQVVCAAAADQIGLARFMIACRGRASNALENAGGRSQTGGVRYVQYVPTLTLDSLLDHFPAPNLLKIDVEGAESIVLAGANRVLAEVRPLIYCEVGLAQSREVASCLKRHGYVLFDGDAEEGAEIDDCAFNTFAVPKERLPTTRFG